MLITLICAVHEQQVNRSYLADTKLHKGIERIFPKFSNKFEAISVRVPTVNVTVMDLSVTVHTNAVNDINQTIVNASQCTLRGIVDYTEAPFTD